MTGPTEQGSRVYWTTITLDHWQFIVAAIDEGLVYVDLVKQAPEQNEELYADFMRWTSKYCRGYSMVRDDRMMHPYVSELMEYWRGERQEFSMPVVLWGTDFQIAVWNALLDIDYGKTRAYVEIAEQIGRPQAVRAVGAAVGANPLMIVIPCHRVIGKDGSLTGFGGGLDLKIRLLEIEGRSSKDGYVQYA